MEKYRSILKRRLTFMTAFNGLIVAFIVLTGIYRDMSATGNDNLADMIKGFQVGIFFGLQVMFIIYIVRYTKALRNDVELKKLYINENDERTKLIHDKIGGTGFNVILCGIASAVVISGFFSQIVFVTLLCVLIFVVSVKGSLKIYYRNKL